MEAWDSDANEDYEDDLIDNFRITMLLIDFQQSNLHSVQGEGGIGNFTLIYYNLTTDPTSCSTVNNPATSTSTHILSNVANIQYKDIFG